MTQMTDEQNEGRILVVDDDTTLCVALRRALAPRANVVVDAYALSAIARLDRGERFDLILCDVNMPGMLGTDFVRFVQRFDPAAARAVVLMTAGDVPAGLPVGCLTKPLNIEALRAMLRARRAARLAL